MKPPETPSLFGELWPEPDRQAAPPNAAPRRAGRVGTAAEAGRLGALASALPSALRLGTSSWSFPGWNGLVYDHAASESALARNGLAAYARHPLFRTVGVDKTFYRPAPRAEFERLAAQVPDGFGFLVKVWRGIVERDPHRAASPAAFLDARVAVTDCIAPALEGLGGKAGPILFQFTPMRLSGASSARAFIAELGAFLGRLPRGALYAVEVRNAALVGPELGETLAERGAVPCLTVHPTMPDLEIQSRELALDATRPLVMRWMLRANHRYEDARDLYAPFDRIVEPDDASCAALARLAKGALAAGLGAWVVVNNKAEGSSPLSVERLARRIAGE